MDVCKAHRFRAKYYAGMVVGGYGRPVGAERAAMDLSFALPRRKHPALSVAIAIYSFPSFLLAQLK